MKVAHVGYSDSSGGASKGMMLIHSSLIEVGIDSHVFVAKKETYDIRVTQYYSKYARFAFGRVDTLYKRLSLKKGAQFSLSFSGRWNLRIRQIVKQINKSDFDVVHIHWLANGLFPVDIIKDLEKPVVITLRDMWAFTGGCHYSENCDKFRSLCRECHLVKLGRSSHLQERIQSDKYENFRENRARVSFIALSEWLADAAMQSRVLEGFPVEVIPNPISSRIDSFLVNNNAKRQHGSRVTIVFGSIDINEERKGLADLLEALNIVTRRKGMPEIKLIIFGSGKPVSGLGYDVTYVGQLDMMGVLEVISEASFCVFPSHEEAFGKTALESIAMGVPCIVYKQTGLEDIIFDERLGRTAKYLDTENLAEKIMDVIANLDGFNSNIIRNLAKERFSRETVVEKHVKLYKKIAGIVDVEE